jgi:Fe-Mn family superoxide dismutase
MAYEAKDFGRLIGMPGFSETLLKNHFTLYQGYVANTNKVAAMAAEMAKGKEPSSPASSELRRRFGWEWNGMRLHELYFGNLGGKGTLDKGGKPGKALAAAFGSVEAWEADFRAAGVMRGIGWVVLARDPANGALFNCWINEHDAGHLAGCAPLLVMDVFEHAYLTDYGLKRADYIAAFFANIDWKAVESRL